MEWLPTNSHNGQAGSHQAVIRSGQRHGHGGNEEHADRPAQIVKVVAGQATNNYLLRAVPLLIKYKVSPPIIIRWHAQLVGILYRRLLNIPGEWWGNRQRPQRDFQGLEGKCGKTFREQNELRQISTNDRLIQESIKNELCEERTFVSHQSHPLMKVFIQLRRKGNWNYRGMSKDSQK